MTRADKRLVTKIFDLCNGYKLTSILAVYASKKEDYDFIINQYKILKDIWKRLLDVIKTNYTQSIYEDVLQFKLADLPDELQPLQTVDIYNKILALKFSDVKTLGVKQTIELNNLSIELNPQEEIPYINIAKALYRDKQYEKALVYCDKIKTPESAPVWEILGDIYRETGDYGSAIEVYNKYLLLNENDTQGVEKLKQTYLEALENSTIKEGQAESEVLASALSYVAKKRPAKAFGEFIKLYKIKPDNKELIKNILSNLLVLKGYGVITDTLAAKIKPYINQDSEICYLYASALFSSQEHYSESIPLFKKLSEVMPKDSSVWFKLAFSMERVYQDKYLDEQIKYAKIALKLSENDTSLMAFLARLLYRKGKKEECQKCFKKMLKSNPKPEDIVMYSRFLMKEGKLTEGYDIYRCRFDTGIVAYPKLLTKEKRWNGKDDLSDATVIVHYEQGFGDSVMFSRYIPELSKIAKKIIFVVQKNLIPVFKSSGFDNYCEILSHEADVNPHIKLEDTNRSVMYSNGKGMDMIEHDYHIPLMDLPYLMKESPDKMYHSGGYLRVNPDKVNEFKEKYINKNNKYKIALAYHGTKDSILTYRDISVKHFLPLFKMDGVEFYSFQSDEYAKELQDLDKNIKIVDLGKVFKNFEDTACAMECMDLMLSTDNVVMNLGGALGVKTYALFNKYTESRWYTVDGYDLGWYKSVRPFHAKTFNDWENLILDVKSEIEKDL